MPATIFITGVSGYIGGTTFVHLVKQHPEWTINALIRNEDNASTLKKSFPSVNFVIGALDSKDVLVAESEKADVVLNLASSDDIPAIQSYLEGLSRRPETANRYLIHTSGTGMLANFSTGEGNESSKIYSDIADVKEITSLDLTHFHRDVDDAVISGGLTYNVRTAIISPPTVYGVGKGPIKKRSIQIPALIQGILSRGKGFTVGEGNNLWDLVHVDDLAAAYILLVEEALKEGGGRATWGAEGYYFAETGEFRWKSISEAVTKYSASKGVVKSVALDKLTGQEAAAIHPWGPLIWGSNCRSRADRLRSLGWKGQAPDVYAELPTMVELEINASQK